MKEVVHRESLVSSDKPAASAATFSSPLVPPVSESSPTQSRTSNDVSFQSPFLITAPPDVFNSPSVKCSRGAEISRRRPSPFPYHPEHYSKKLKLSSSDLPDDGKKPKLKGSSDLPDYSMKLKLSSSDLPDDSKKLKLEGSSDLPDYSLKLRLSSSDLTDDSKKPKLEVSSDLPDYSLKLRLSRSDLADDSKKLKLSSSDLPDSGSSPSECDMSLPLVTSNTSPSPAMLSPLSPIRSPTADESSNSVLPQMQSMSSELDALLAPEIDSSEVNSPPRHFNNTPESDSQVNSSDSQVCSPEAPSSVATSLQLPSEQEPSSPMCSQSEESLSPELHSPPRQTPLSPESPASLSYPLVNSPPPPEVQSDSAAEEPEINHSSLIHEPESEVCSSTTLPASVSELAPSDLSHAEAEPVYEDREIESGEKSVDPADTEVTAETQETCSVSETSCSTSDKGTVFE